MAAAIDGIVLLDKPLGLSSNAALQRVKHLYGAHKAGHSGSLDPLASGMLPVCLGEATKIAGTLLDSRKCYVFTIQLGARTSTGDVEGEIVERRPVPALDLSPPDLERPHAAEEAPAGIPVCKVLQSFPGPRLQVPPMYSALKRDGRRLYDLARRGMEVERKPRPIELYEISPVDLQPSAITARVVCSKGTYIRVLAEEIAVALGTCGHVSLLRRLWVEPFVDELMVSLDTLAALKAEGGDLGRYLLPLDRGLADWPRVDLDEQSAERFSHGQKLRLSAPMAVGHSRVYGPPGRLLGLADLDAGGVLKPRRLIAAHQASE